MKAARAAPETRRPRTGHLAGATLLLSASFVFSRVLGLLRNVVIADVFGATRQVEAYFAAFRIPDTMFMLASGGALASAFVPVFAGLVQRKHEHIAWEVASSVLNTVFLALACLALAAFALAPLFIALLVPDYTPAERAMTVDLTRIMLLQPIFLGVSALISAILQTYQRFVLTAVAPLLYNLAVILGALLGRSHGVAALAWAVVIGSLAQLLVQLPGLWPQAGLLYHRSIDWSFAESREVLRLFLPRVVGLAAFQAMLFITLYLAQGLPKGNVAAINYSWLLISFPVGALGTAAATAIFPTLSRLVETEDYDALAGTVGRGLRFVLFLALPAAMGLIVLRRPIINLLYNHGAWTHHATEQTAFALLFYAMALTPLAAIEILPRVFYALRDTVTPVRIAVVAVALDAVLSIVLVHLLPPSSGQGGLALASALANGVQVVWLAVAVNRDLGGRMATKEILSTLRNAALGSLGMGVVLYLTLDPLTAIFAQHGFGALFTVCIEVSLGAATFVYVMYLLGAPELYQLRGFLGRTK